MMDMPIGSCWRHYKNGDVYEITGFTFSEASNDLKVVYRPLVTELVGDISLGLELVTLGQLTERDLDGLQFDRPPHEFHEKIVIECPADITEPAKTVNRFTRVRRADCYVALGYRG